jgi:LTXXQ motif family protein
VVITLQCSLTAMIEGPPSSDASVAAFGATSRRSLEIELPNLPGAHAGVRLKAMEQRLAAMFQAVQTVEPVLEKFYGSLSDEQKKRFNRLPPRQA